MPTDPTARRPLKSRDLPFFKHLAASLAQAGVSPNAISFSSMVFGAAAGVMLAATSALQGWAVNAAWLLSTVFIQLRLVANLLDGMVAVEGKRGGPTGDLWNEAPDRVADAAIFIGAGYAVGSLPLLGFAAALMAVFVAYVRALGASVGAGQIFIGPMAKPQRMFAMTVMSFLGIRFGDHFPPFSLAAISYRNASPESYPPHFVETGHSEVQLGIVTIVLALIILGCIVTAIRRLLRIAAFLRAKTS